MLASAAERGRWADQPEMTAWNRRPSLRSKISTARADGTFGRLQRALGMVVKDGLMQQEDTMKHAIFIAIAIVTAVTTGIARADTVTD